MVTVRRRSHCRRVTVLPLADWVTLRSRVPLIEVSVVETTYPPAEIFFFICRSCAWLAEETASNTSTDEPHNCERVGMVHSFELSSEKPAIRHASCGEQSGSPG